MAARYPTIKAELAVGADLSTNQAVGRDSTETLPANTPLSQPYWLREDHTVGMFRVADSNLIGQPENPPVFPVEQVFEVGGQTLVVPDQPVQNMASAREIQFSESATNATRLISRAKRAKGETRHLDVISPVSLKLVSDVGLFAPGAARPVMVEVTAARPDTAGTLRLDAPAGWKVTPATESFRLGIAGDQAKFTFMVTAPSQPATANITAKVEIGHKHYDNERVVINYPHIPLLLLQPPARFKAVCLNLAIRGL